MNKPIQSERNCGIDLLRIIAMYMVVVLHVLGGAFLKLVLTSL